MMRVFPFRFFFFSESYFHLSEINTQTEMSMVVHCIVGVSFLLVVCYFYMWPGADRILIANLVRRRCSRFSTLFISHTLTL